MKKAFLYILYIYIGTGVLFAQTKAQLERQRQQLREEINRINNDLKKNRSREKDLLTEYELTEKKLQLRRKLIRNIKNEISYLNRHIARKKDTVDMLNEELEQLKKNYADAVRKLYRFQSKEKVLYFVLSSESFQQAWRRIRYLKEYSDFVKKKAKAIEKKEKELQQVIAKLNEEKAKKEQMLTVLSDEQRQLEAEKRRQESLLADLKRQRRKYMAEIKRKQREARRIDREIEKIIAAEIRRRNKGKNAKGFILTPEGKQLAAEFSANKGKLPWPVKRGYVSRHFGKQPHPVFPNLSVINNGIYINVPDNEPVRSVFKGEVMMIQAVPGGNATVYIRHGNYLSIYGNLKEVFVKKGQKVSTKQIIGTAAKDPATGVSVLKFRIYQNRQKLNPELWLARK